MRGSYSGLPDEPQSRPRIARALLQNQAIPSHFHRAKPLDLNPAHMAGLFLCSIWQSAAKCR